MQALRPKPQAQFWVFPVTRVARSRIRTLAAGGSWVDPKLLEILVCPLCKGPLVYRRAAGELICKADRLGFPIRDGIPVMLEEDARKLSARRGSG